MRRTIMVCVVLAFLLGVTPHRLISGGETQKSAPVGAGLLPDGFSITPTAAPGSIFRGLPTGLRSDGSADANGAVTAALSPDGTALLVVTTGYNKNFSNPDGTPITHSVLDPTTGLPSSTTDSRAEWIFLFDVRGS